MTRTNGGQSWLDAPAAPPGSSMAAASTAGSPTRRRPIRAAPGQRGRSEGVRSAASDAGAEGIGLGGPGDGGADEPGEGVRMGEVGSVPRVGDLDLLGPGDVCGQPGQVFLVELVGRAADPEDDRHRELGDVEELLAVQRLEVGHERGSVGEPVRPGGRFEAVPGGVADPSAKERLDGGVGVRGRRDRPGRPGPRSAAS